MKLREPMPVISGPLSDEGHSSCVNSPENSDVCRFDHFPLRPLVNSTTAQLDWIKTNGAGTKRTIQKKTSDVIEAQIKS